jgi:hypothetical protein
MKKILFYLICSALFFSCTVNQTVLVKKDGSGSSEINVKLHPVMTAYLTDLTAMLGDEPDPEKVDIFEPEAMEYAFSHYEYMNLTDINVPDKDTAVFTVAFDDIGAILSAREEEFGRLFSFKSGNGVKKIDILVDQGVIRHILSFSPAGQTMADTLLPPADYSFTREEYIEYLEWPLEEYLEGKDLETVLENSIIRLEMTVQGDIIEVSGGEVHGNTVKFSLPVLEPLISENPVTYSLTFR